MYTKKAKATEHSLKKLKFRLYNIVELETPKFIFYEQYKSNVYSSSK